MKLNIILLTIVSICLITPIFGCVSPSQKMKAEEDKIVVEHAEAILWEFSYIYTPPWGFRSFEDSNRAFQIELAMDDIFFFEEEHPFIPEEFDNYIKFKADYYREWFNWGRLPPEDIMEKAGVSENP